MKQVIHNAKTGTTVEGNLTAEEETSLATQAEASSVKAQEVVDAKTAQDAEDAQKATDKASAKVKLKAAEYTPLTEAEADAITK